MSRSRKRSGLVAATVISALFANNHAYSSEQVGVVPVELEDAVVQAALEGCVPNALGDLPVVAENASQLGSAGLIPIEEENGFASLPVVPFEDLHKKNLLRTSFAIRPSINGRVVLGATPRVAYCGIVVFDAPAVQARENLVRAIIERGWELDSGAAVGDIETFSAVVKKKNISISVTGRDRASANDAGYRLFVSIVQTKD